MVASGSSSRVLIGPNGSIYSLGVCSTCCSLVLLITQPWDQAYLLDSLDEATDERPSLDNELFYSQGQGVRPGIVVDSFMGRYYRRRRRSKEGDTTING
jgi:hypothetical protein